MAEPNPEAPAQNKSESDDPVTPDEKLLELRAEFERQATPLDRFSARATGILARPGATLAIIGLAAAWVGGNMLAPRFGMHTFDPPPFQSLQAFGTIVSIILATLILAGQRHEDQAGRRRSQLTLHYVVQSEHKIAKLISLLEEQRRHNPILPDREDTEAEEMSRPSEPREVVDLMERPSR